ncbi:HAD family hydrolase [Alisedimentitalea sp. MJ-SS2]|uniref:HAD family hydrolase n=1 Tax=Aliisedimentitalea sp. MJ-SS2 TaxID=3049795 RepID=UPI00290E57D8|nr:HAD family hydrolase [Alisedimentitalea sp. MJ-SS2]MDU8929416.1 HAD family hydrolase [Alisedimentitalea sp. MJ-SS2]
MKPIKHVSFDLDGTLINSFATMKIAWEAATDELNINCGFEEYRRYVGLPFPKILQMLGLSNSLIELNELYFAGTRRLYDQIPVIDGANELIDQCRAQGLGTSIITSKPRKNSEMILEKFGFAVDKLICGDDLTKGKPDPMAGILLCEEFSVDPEQVLYVGDAIFDFQFALNAGMQFVMFADHGENRLPGNMLNPVETVDELKQISRYL